MMTFENSLFLFVGYELNKPFVKTYLDFKGDVAIKYKPNFLADGCFLEKPNDKKILVLLQKHHEFLEKQLTHPLAKVHYRMAGPTVNSAVPSGLNLSKTALVDNIFGASYAKIFDSVETSLKEDHNINTFEVEPLEFLFMFFTDTADFNLAKKINTLIEYYNNLEEDQQKDVKLIMSSDPAHSSHFCVKRSFLKEIKELGETHPDFMEDKGWDAKSFFPIGKNIKTYFDSVNIFKEAANLEFQKGIRNNPGLIETINFSLQMYKKDTLKAHKLYLEGEF